MIRKNPIKVLYISNDGALNPLGQSQILHYLRRLGKYGLRITLLSFEKRERLQALNKKASLRRT